MNSKVVKTEEVSKESICDCLREYCNAKGVSQKSAATKIGVSEATINNVLTGKWNVISEEMWRKIWNAVGSGNIGPLFSTADHLAIKKLCSTARKNRLMIGLTGDTGMGKTRSLESIKRGRNTFYITYKKTMNARQFLCAILKEMGIVFEGNKYDMVNRIAEELNVLSSPLLIIDEAGKLPHTVMQYLHDLRDSTMLNCGIVLAGMPYFEDNLRKQARKQKEGCAEFLRRINLWHRMSGLSRDEIEYVCAQNDITDKATLKEFYNNKRFGDLLNQILLYQIEQIATSDDN